MRRRVWRVLAVVAALLAVAVVGFALWAWDAAEADADALAAVRNASGVEVVEAGGLVAVLPADDAQPDRGVVFYPGARVSPDAYVATWGPIVEETGTAVYIPSMPLNLAFFDVSRADDVIADHPEVPRWWVGGHSLGGAMAAAYADRTEPGELEGVVLWGAYTTARSDLSERDDLALVSVSGSRDGLSTPEEVAAGAAFLPGGAELVEIEGMNHAQFGRYGPQAGDGTATIGDAEATERVARAMAGFWDGRGDAAARPDQGPAARAALTGIAAR